VRPRYRQAGSMDGVDRTQSFVLMDFRVERDSRMQRVTRHIPPPT